MACPHYMFLFDVPNLYLHSMPPFHVPFLMVPFTAIDQFPTCIIRSIVLLQIMFEVHPDNPSSSGECNARKETITPVLTLLGHTEPKCCIYQTLRTTSKLVSDSFIDAGQTPTFNKTDDCCKILQSFYKW